MFMLSNVHAVNWKKNTVIKKYIINKVNIYRQNRLVCNWLMSYYVNVTLFLLGDPVHDTSQIEAPGK